MALKSKIDNDGVSSIKRGAFSNAETFTFNCSHSNFSRFPVLSFSEDSPEYYKIDEWDDEERTPSAGQAEFIVAKHRNGGLNNIKLKFISNLGKFENLDNFETPFEYQSKINKDDLKVNPDQAFESGGYREDNDDMPF